VIRHKYRRRRSFNADFPENQPETTGCRRSSTHDGPDGKPIAIFDIQLHPEYLAQKTGKLMPSDTGSKSPSSSG